MEIVLTVAVVAVAVAALYVTATFNKRAKQTTAPLIEDAVNRISERIQEAEDNLRRQLDMITDDLHQDMAQQRLSDRKIQDLLRGEPKSPRTSEPPEAGPGLSGPRWP